MAALPSATPRYTSERNLCMFLARWISMPTVCTLVHRQEKNSSSVVQ